jgi:Ca2+-binding EF-hand superfamily protein/pSer/pThr/pTyr-binding forkhead associated (FHA) protein
MAALPLAELRCDSQGWSYPITRTTTIGRKGKSGDLADVLLSGSKAISRRGAVIEVVQESPPQLELTCIGKNNVHVNGYLLSSGGEAVLLESGDVIAIGGLELEIVLQPVAALGTTTTLETTFTDPGPLGLSLTPEPASDRVMVLAVRPGSQAVHAGVREGLVVETVAGSPVAGRSYEEVTSIISAHPERPLQVTFSSPHSQPPAGDAPSPPSTLRPGNLPARRSPVPETDNWWLSTSWSDREKEFRAVDQKLAARRLAREQKRGEVAQSNPYVRAAVDQSRVMEPSTCIMDASNGDAAVVGERPNHIAAISPLPSHTRRDQGVKADAHDPGRHSTNVKIHRRAAKSPVRPRSVPLRRAPPRRPVSTPRAATPNQATTRAASPSQAFLREAMEKLSNGLTSKLQAREAFRKIDKDGSGELDASDFKLALKYLHLHLNERQIGVLMKHLDKDGDGTVSIEEFMHVVFEGKLKRLRKKFQELSYSIGGQDYEKLFRHYDRSNSGALTADDFRRAVRKDVGMREAEVTDADLQDMFDHVDRDRNGYISLNDFAELLSAEMAPVSHDRHDSVAGQIFHQILKQSAKKRCNLRHLFTRFDQDESGGLGREQFRLAMADLGVIISPSQMDAVMEDTATQGFISTSYFIARMREAKNDARAAAAENYEVKTKLDDALPAKDGKRGDKSPQPNRSQSPKKKRPTTPKQRPRPVTPTTAVPAARATNPSEAFLNEAIERLCSKLTSKLQAREAFRKIDKDGSGELDASEFKLALKYLHLHLNERQIGVLMKHLDKDGDGTVSIEEFMHVVFEGKLKRLRKKFQAAAYTIGGIDLEKLFRHYDRDNSGTMSFDEFTRAVRTDVGMTKNEVTDEELKEMFDHVAKDGGGDIGLDEFKELLHMETETDHRYDSVPDQVFFRILEHADKKHANLLHLFHRFDDDDSGGLEPEEFRKALLELGVPLSADELQQVMDEMDSDGDGYVSTKEFSDRLRLAKKHRRAMARQEQERERAALRAEKKARGRLPQSDPAPTSSGASLEEHTVAQHLPDVKADPEAEPEPESGPEPEPLRDLHPGATGDGAKPAHQPGVLPLPVHPVQLRSDRVGSIGLARRHDAAEMSLAVAVSPALSLVLPQESFRPTSSFVGSDVAHKPQGHGVFAELRCAAEGWVYQMTQPSIVLGRHGKSGPTADVLLTGSKAISRRHAEISAVDVGGLTMQLQLSCVGKNHVTVNDKLYAANSSGITLQTGDTVTIGGVELEVFVLN